MKRLALIGTGGHGVYHLEEIRKAEAAKKVKLVAVADPNFGSQITSKFKETGVVTYSGYLKMMESEAELDYLVICTPVCLHEAMLLQALRYPRIRRILLEKPPLPTVEQMRRAIAADPLQRTRVAFQMILFSEMQFLKQAILSGRYGRLRSVTISAGWPRKTAYYERATWAGRMELAGEPVFDGPATNALSHLLHNALFLANETGSGFASPEMSEGEFYRARPIESYDFAWISARVGAVRVQAAVAHCLDRYIPWRMRIETDSAHWVWSEQSGLQGVDVSPMTPRVTQTEPIYDAFLAGDEEFSRMPNTLTHTFGYTQWTCGGLLASGGIRSIPSEAVRIEEDLFIVAGLAQYLEEFETHRRPPSAVFDWANESHHLPATSSNRRAPDTVELVEASLGTA